MKPKWSRTVARTLTGLCIFIYSFFARHIFFKLPVNVLNRRVCGICFGILITVDNKYTLILGLWKCGTIAQLYYYIVDISARAGY